MIPGPDSSKSDWRRYFQAQLAQLPPPGRARSSSLLRGRLMTQPEWQRARTLLAFMPTADEPDILALTLGALDAGKSLSLPRHDSASDSYAAVRITDLSRDLIPGRFGLLEPRPECPILPPNELDFCLVPGLGFALDGGRLGRGRGYFDRLLAAVPGFKCGVAFDCQVVPELPKEPHDVRLDCILTPTRWHPTASRARS
jgi:5-formyltetrahydrofolate cyclo-ligase